MDAKSDMARLEEKKAEHAKEVYDELFRHVDPIVTSFRTDLTKHDKAFIEQDPVSPFLHFSGDTGTNIIRLIEARDFPPRGECIPYLFGTADREHLLSETLSMVRAMPNANRQEKVLYYDGNKVNVISQERAEGIAEAYVRKIRRQWRKKECKNGTLN